MTTLIGRESWRARSRNQKLEELAIDIWEQSGLTLSPFLVLGVSETGATRGQLNGAGSWLFLVIGGLDLAEKSSEAMFPLIFTTIHDGNFRWYLRARHTKTGGVENAR